MSAIDRITEAQARYEEAELHANYYVLQHKLGLIESEIGTELSMKLAERYSELMEAIEQYRKVEG